MSIRLMLSTSLSTREIVSVSGTSSVILIFIMLAALAAFVVFMIVFMGEKNNNLVLELAYHRVVIEFDKLVLKRVERNEFERIGILDDGMGGRGFSV